MKGDSCATTAPPLREITAEDVRFLALYTASRQQDCTGQATPSEQDIEQLRQRVLHLCQTCLAEASVLYKCVRDLRFLEPRVDQHFHYPEVLATIAAADPHARYLDLGCCFGTDTRKVILDGWKEENLVAVDVIPDFWNWGLQLYEDASLLKIQMRQGDVTSDDAFVQSLAADGRFMHVWTGAVLHVLNEAKVEALLRSVFALLAPGGTYFGTCAGTVGQPREWQPEFRNRSPAYLHTAESLKALLERLGFQQVEVRHARRITEEETPDMPRAFMAIVASKPACPL